MFCLSLVTAWDTQEPLLPLQVTTAALAQCKSTKENVLTFFQGMIEWLLSPTTLRASEIPHIGPQIESY